MTEGASREGGGMRERETGFVDVWIGILLTAVLAFHEFNTNVSVPFPIVKPCLMAEHLLANSPPGGLPWSPLPLNT